jgi:hypothetical protein
MVAAAEAAVTAAEATAAADLEDFGGGALIVALAQEAEPGDSLRECWLARERLRVSEARSINRAEILTARTDAAAEAAEVTATEAAAAEASAAAEAAAEAAGLAQERPSRPSCRKSSTAARTVWPRTPREFPGGPCLCGARVRVLAATAPGFRRASPRAAERLS